MRHVSRILRKPALTGFVLGVWVTIVVILIAMWTTGATFGPPPVPEHKPIDFHLVSR